MSLLQDTQAENERLRAELATLRSQEPVAEVCSGWRLAFVGSEPIATVLAGHPEVRIGTLLYTRPAPVPAAPLTLTDEQIIKIAETMGRDIPGESNYESWGQGYRKDESGAYRIPNAPKLCVPFARAILAVVEDGSAYRARLVTMPDFGCVQHEHA